jgi:hypothetical protein
MGKLIDLTGKRFGNLIVIERDRNYIKVVRWVCKCDCGNTKTIRGHCLKSGATISCGCLLGKSNKDKRRPQQSEKHIGKRFNRLTVIGIEENGNGSGYYLITKCDCGNITKNLHADLKNNKVYSCGCYQKEKASISGSKNGLNNGTINCSKRK